MRAPLLPTTDKPCTDIVPFSHRSAADNLRMVPYNTPFVVQASPSINGISRKTFCMTLVGLAVVVGIGTYFITGSRQQTVLPPSPTANVPTSVSTPADSSNPATSPTANIPNLPFLPSSNYACLGYDILHGDPFASTVDPGYRNPVFDCRTAVSGKTTQDGKNLLPDSLEAVNFDSCNLQQGGEHLVSSGQTSFAQNMKTDVSVSGGWGDLFSFTGSHSFQSNVKNTGSTADDKISFYSRALLTLFRVNVNKYTAPLDPNFTAAVKVLPVGGDASSYISFLNDFGSHYVSSVVLGARYGVVTVASSGAVRIFESDGESYQNALSSSMKYQLFGAGGKYNNSDEKAKTENDKWSHTVDSVSSFYIGSDPVSLLQADGGFEQWTGGIRESPMPVGASVALITDLLSADHFPGDPDIATKNAMMTKALTDWCNTPANTGLCVNYLPDKPYSLEPATTTQPTTTTPAPATPTSVNPYYMADSSYYDDDHNLTKICDSDAECPDYHVCGALHADSDTNICCQFGGSYSCLLYTSPSPRDRQKSRMPSSA